MMPNQKINRTGETGALLVKVSTALFQRVAAGYHYRWATQSVEGEMRSLKFRIVAFLIILVAIFSIAGGAMAYNPISEIEDRELSVTQAQMDQLVEFRRSEKFTELPGYDTKEEQERLSKVFDRLLDKLICGIAENPTKLWVMKQFQVALKQVELEDTEGREDFGELLMVLMDILEIKSSNGLVMFYLG